MRWTVAEEEVGVRLDVYIARHRGVSRNRAHGWIRAHRVMVDSSARRPSQLLVGGEQIVLREPVIESELRPESGDVEILYEDEDLVAVDKPAGIVVHPGAGQAGGTLLNRLLGRYPEIGVVGSPKRPGIVHRLDVGTTGVLLIARSQRAYHALSRAFAERRMKKRYLAFAYGALSPSAGTIDRPNDE